MPRDGIEILLDDLQGKFDLVLEEQAKLDNKLDRIAAELNRKIDALDASIGQEIEALQRKIDEKFEQLQQTLAGK